MLNKIKNLVNLSLNANPEEENKMTNNNNTTAANVGQNIIGGVNMEKVFNEELASVIAEVIGNETKIEEEVKVEKVSVLDRFAKHHNYESKQEDIEIDTALEDKVAEVIAEIEKQKELKKDAELLERMVAMEEKKAMAKATVSKWFGNAKKSAVIAKDKVAGTVDTKVNDFLFGSLDEESSAPVEEVKSNAELKGEEVAASAKDIYASIVEKKEAFFAEHSVKPAFKAQAPVVEEEEVVSEDIEDIINKMREELIKEAKLKKELEEVKAQQSKAQVLREEMAAIKAQIDFIESQRAAEDAGVPEQDILRTKDDIDAFFKNW